MRKLFNIQADERSFSMCEEFPTKDKIGLEVELESVPMDDVRFKFLSKVHDGSLRDGGVEFVFRNPLCGTDLKSALDELETYLSLNDVITYGERTSVHVHVDIRDLTTRQLFKFLNTHLVFERSLFNFAGPERIQSNFCRPLGELHEALETIGRLNPESQYFNFAQCEFDIGEYGKYSSVNLSAIPRFGSVEFRLHEGTTDVSRIRKWINILLKMKQFAYNSDTRPEEFSSILSEAGPEYLSASVFQEYSSYVEADPNFVENCYDGVRNLEFAVHYLDIAAHSSRAQGKPLKKTAKPKSDTERELENLRRHATAARRQREVPIPQPPVWIVDEPR